MSENEGAGGGEARRDAVLATMLQVYFESLRREPLPGRLVETVRELVASPPPQQKDCWTSGGEPRRLQ
jgi:hypothetical protein